MLDDLVEAGDRWPGRRVQLVIPGQTITRTHAELQRLIADCDLRDEMLIRFGFLAHPQVFVCTLVVNKFDHDLIKLAAGHLDTDRQFCVHGHSALFVKFRAQDRDPDIRHAIQLCCRHQCTRKQIAVAQTRRQDQRDCNHQHAG